MKTDWKELNSRITDADRELFHCLGIRDSDIEQGNFCVRRNHYYPSDYDKPFWDLCVVSGLASKSEMLDGPYSITQTGVKYLETSYGIKLVLSDTFEG